MRLVKWHSKKPNVISAQEKNSSAGGQQESKDQNQYHPDEPEQFWYQYHKADTSPSVSCFYDFICVQDPNKITVIHTFVNVTMLDKSYLIQRGIKQYGYCIDLFRPQCTCLFYSWLYQLCDVHLAKTKHNYFRRTFEAK